MTHMLALDPATTRRPLRRTTSALRMRAHPLREDLRGQYYLGTTFEPGSGGPFEGQPL
ncbi:hypothetical protein ACFWR9_05685 [Streptomyces sp. NPDC058534]|uniref:hypothetical protein n=1 Tax=Streptomyces sp. NPDC058534 TaxID=3346541 RepID=UPI00364CE22B